LLGIDLHALVVFQAFGAAEISAALAIKVPKGCDKRIRQSSCPEQ